MLGIVVMPRFLVYRHIPVQIDTFTAIETAVGKQKLDILIVITYIIHMQYTANTHTVCRKRHTFTLLCRHFSKCRIGKLKLFKLFNTADRLLTQLGCHGNIGCYRNQYNKQKFKFHSHSARYFSSIPSFLIRYSIISRTAPSPPFFVRTTSAIRST